MPRCGCAGSVCSCNITVEGNGDVSGTGSEASPFVITIDPSAFEVADTPSITLELTGSGTDADPYHLEATAIGDLDPSPQAAPLGSILMYAGDAGSVPTGWFLCDGSGKSTTTYDDLFDLIGYTYGGTGASFNVPDMRNRLPVGVGGSGWIGAEGENEGELVADRTIRHTHGDGDLTATESGSGHTHNLNIADPNLNTADNTPTTGAAKRLTGGEHHTHSGSTANSTGSQHTHGIDGTTGDGGTNAAVAPYLGVNFIIKYLP